MPRGKLGPPLQGKRPSRNRPPQPSRGRSPWLGPRIPGTGRWARRCPRSQLVRRDGESVGSAYRPAGVVLALFLRERSGLLGCLAGLAFRAFAPPSVASAPAIALPNAVHLALHAVRILSAIFISVRPVAPALILAPRPSLILKARRPLAERLLRMVSSEWPLARRQTLRLLTPPRRLPSGPVFLAALAAAAAAAAMAAAAAATIPTGARLPLPEPVPLPSAATGLSAMGRRTATPAAANPPWGAARAAIWPSATVSRAQDLDKRSLGAPFAGAALHRVGPARPRLTRVCALAALLPPR